MTFIEIFVVVGNNDYRGERRIKKMKFNFKKISAIFASGIMLASGVGFAAAASFPAPFSSGTTAGTAIVYSSNAASNDGAAVASINDFLSDKVTSDGVDPTGDFVQLERSNDRFNMNNSMSSFYSKINEGELSRVLAKGEYINDAHESFDYEQEITLGTSLLLQHFLDSDFNDDKPIIGFDLASGQQLFNYTLKFTPDYAEGGASWASITNSNIPMLGESYYVLTMANTTGTDHKLTLLNAASTGSLKEGETTTITTASGSYEVSLDLVDANSKAKFTVNGEVTDGLLASETQKLSDGSYIGVREVSYVAKDSGLSQVEFSIGSGKLVLENGKEVELNSEKLSVTDYDVVNSDETVSYKVTSFIKTSGTDIQSITLEWLLDDDSWIAPGTELVLPGFESVKISMSEFVTPKKEATTLKGDSNKLTLSTTITDGPLDLNVFYLNATSTGISGLGKDSTHKLVTSETTGSTTVPITLNLNETLNNYFVVTWISGDDFETYAYELEDVDETAKNKTTIKSLSGGADVTIDEVNDFDDEGNVRFTLSYSQEKNPSKAYAIINITAASSGNVYANKLVTAEGLEISLPVANVSGTAVGNYQININATGNTSMPTSWKMMFDEEDKDGTISGGNQFNATIGFSGTDGIEVASLGISQGVATYETEDDSDKYEGYVYSDLATYVLLDTPTSGLNKLDVTYHGDEAYAKVFVTEAASASGNAGNMMFKDNERTSWASKDVVLVGGSCINTATAEKLTNGVAKCGEEFTSATGVGANQFLIKTVDGFATGKVALIVAGYESTDTLAAVEHLKTGVIDTTVGKSYKGTAGGTVDVVEA
jgi:hypothetical protein